MPFSNFICNTKGSESTIEAGKVIARPKDLENKVLDNEMNR